MIAMPMLLVIAFLSIDSQYPHAAYQGIEREGFTVV
jgi:hypothetical protein